MSSQSTRYEIVTKALSRAGRGMELRHQAETWLNDFLRSCALEFRWPQLKKIGDPITLSAGSSTASLPSDFGAGMDNLLLGSERTPLDELSMDEFVTHGGFPADTLSSSRPRFYLVDRDQGVFRFGSTADQNYSVTPIYWRLPAAIPTPSSEGDLQKVWLDDDNLVIEGLIQLIYQYTGDQREFVQDQKVEAKKANIRRGMVPMSGGASRMTLSRSRFK